MTGTLADYMATVDSQVGVTPYYYGGSTLWVGVDCSGLLFAAAELQGVPIPRSTQEQWNAAIYGTQNMRVVANTPKDPVIPGDGVYFYVPGDGGEPPQHVGMYVGLGQMIDAPHTGLWVQQEAIPNVPGIIWPMGFARITGFRASPPPEPPAPPQEEDMAAADPISGGVWVTDATGAIFAFDGAPFLGNLVDHPQWHAGTPTDPCVGVAFWKGDGNAGGGNGYALITRPAGSPQPDIYRFPRDGSLVPK